MLMKIVGVWFNNFKDGNLIIFIIEFNILVGCKIVI